MPTKLSLIVKIFSKTRRYVITKIVLIRLRGHNALKVWEKVNIVVGAVASNLRKVLIMKSLALTN